MTNIDAIHGMLLAVVVVSLSVGLAWASSSNSEGQTMPFTAEQNKELRRRQLVQEAQVDPANVDAIINGWTEARDCTRAERQAAVVALTAKGLTAVKIAAKLRISERLVTRARARARAEQKV